MGCEPFGAAAQLVLGGTFVMREASNAYLVAHNLRREFRPYTRAEVSQLPKERRGVYAIWRPRSGSERLECVYVGESRTCVRRRLLEHLSSEEPNVELRNQLQLYRTIVVFSVEFTGDAAATLLLETELIRTWRPKTNQNKLE